MSEAITILSGGVLVHMNGVTWWTCPHCKRKVHANIVHNGKLSCGYDFACNVGVCTLRHCISWEQSPPVVYSYDPKVCDYTQLPYLAQV